MPTSNHYTTAWRFRPGTTSEMEPSRSSEQAVRKALKGQQTFHWPLEFPEVFQKQGGFDAFVCNPPFMGGQKITGNLSDPYREYLVGRLAEGQRGSADLCAYFFLRAKQLLRDGGQWGFLATNTIAQGDTREVSLEQLTVNGCVIPRAVPEPGMAWWCNCFLRCCLDETRSMERLFCSGRSSRRPGSRPSSRHPARSSGNPYRLKANESKSFIGSYVLGMGFVLEPEEAQRLIDKDARNRDVLFPYLTGEDLNSRPDQSPSRFVINFFDWPIEQAIQYPDCFRIIEEKVKPERMRNNRKVYRDRWWHFAEKRPELYRTIAGMKQVMAISLVNNHLGVGLVPTGTVFAHKLAVFACTTGIFSA